MTKEVARFLISEYSEVAEYMPATAVIGMIMRLPPDASECKVMRWLGFCQGVMVSEGRFTLDEVKEHSKRGYVCETVKSTCYINI